MVFLGASDGALVKASTKAEAIQETRRYMKTRKGTVRIHKVNGKIQEERTYPAEQIHDRPKGEDLSTEVAKLDD